MKMIVVLALAAMAMAEPEADPALVYSSYPYGLTYPTTYGVAPLRYAGWPYTHTYNYGKRSAEAEPEAEADPALLYTSSAVVNPVSSYVAASPLVKALTPAATLRTVNTVPVVQTAPVSTVYHAAPVTKTVYNTVPVTKTVYNTLPVSNVYNAVPAVHHASVVPTVNTVVPAVNTVVPAVNTVYSALHHPITSINNVPVTHTIAKREAEADPAVLTYANTLPYVAGTHAVLPATHLTYSLPQTVVPSTYSIPQTVGPSTYAVANVATVAKALDHGVVPTTQGLVHSSHFGACLNNMGVRVPC